MRCHQCNELGHMERDCPNEKVDDSVPRRKRPNAFELSTEIAPPKILSRRGDLKEFFQESMKEAYEKSSTHEDMAQIIE